MRIRTERGFTLMEIIVVMVLMGILAGIIVVPVMTGARAWSNMSRQNEVVQQARIGLDRFVREVRAIQWVNGRPSVKEMAANRIRFVTATGQDLTYCWNDPVNCDAADTTSLIRKDNLAAQKDVAALNVQGFNLLYYEDSNAEHPQFRQEAEATTPPPVTCGGGSCLPTDDLTALGGKLVQLDAAQPDMTLSFSGTRIVVIGPKGNDLGKANVQIDDAGGTQVFAGQIDQFAAQLLPQQLLLVYPPANQPSMAYSSGPYLLTISYINDKNALSSGTAVQVDAFELVVSRVVVGLTVGEGACDTPPNLCTALRDQVSFRSVK